MAGDLMRVGIVYNPAAVTGIATYTRDLMATLSAPCAHPVACEVEAFAAASRDPQPGWLPATVTYRRMRMPGRVHRLLARHVRLPVERLHSPRRLDLLHTLNPEPIHTRLPWVTTVHDLSWRHFRARHGSWMSRSYAVAAEEAIGRADHICADSKMTAEELVQGGIPPRKITVAYLGIDDRFRRLTPPEIRRVREKYHLPEEFLLYVGLINLRKNVGVLIEALRSMGEAPPLVIAGPPPPEGLEHWGLDTVEHRHLGFVPDEDLPGLYGSARMLVFPSLQEGFGLPLLEALAAGVPVAASCIPVFAEIAGEVPEFFDPTDAAALRSALARVLRDEDRRLEMQERGPRRAATFTWAACANATLHAYETVLRGR
jgi:glycosyltransferase involved in cell wall biosynthesis